MADVQFCLLRILGTKKKASATIMKLRGEKVTYEREGLFGSGRWDIRLLYEIESTSAVCVEYGACRVYVQLVSCTRLVCHATNVSIAPTAVVKLGS